MTVQKGQQAPAFKLYDTEGKEVSLDDFKGKNLIMHFYPQAFTGTCTTQLCTVRDAIHQYQNDKADVVAISVDSTFTLAKFKELQNLNFTLLSDFNREASEQYTGFYEKFAMGMKGVCKRAAFVIDGEGIVQYAEILESPGDLPDFKAIDATLASLGVNVSAKN